MSTPPEPREVQTWERDRSTTNPTAKIGIVYFSGYGHISVPGANVHVVEIGKDGSLPDGTWEALAEQDAIILGSPTYMGGPAWQFKKFADESSKVWGTQAWKNKIAGGFTNSATVNGDKASTISELGTATFMHRRRQLGDGSR